MARLVVSDSSGEMPWDRYVRGMTTVSGVRAEVWVRRHPMLAFVGLAYGISWTLWLISASGGGIVPFFLGVLGPMAASGIVTYVRLTLSGTGFVRSGNGAYRYGGGCARVAGNALRRVM